MKVYLSYITLIAALVFTSGCKISVSFVGGTIDAKNFNIGDFPNYAPIVNPVFSQAFVDALRTKIVNESNVKYTQSTAADLVFTGSVKNYSVGPVSATSANTAAGNRLTVTIEVIYVNNVDPKKNFTKSYTEYADFQIDENFNTLEPQFVKEIVDKFTRQVYLDIIPSW